MKKEIYICDRCKAEAATNEEKEALGLGEICLGFSLNYYSHSNHPSIYPPHQHWKKEWCRKCREELGIVQEKIVQNPQAEVPSLEDMVREIVRSELSANQ